MLGNIDIKSRPIRLGLIVDPKDKTSVKNALYINGCLWGGMYNPIIPLYKRTPKNWRILRKNTNYKNVISGYIDAYDVDLVVNCTKEDISNLESNGREMIRSSEILKPMGRLDEFIPSYGLGIAEVLGAVFEEYYKFETKYKPNIVIPQVTKQNSLFYMAVFGAMPDNVNKLIQDVYKDALNITYPKIDENSYINILNRKNWFPRRILQYGVHTLSRNSWDGAYLFFMDPAKTQDVIDYWNLRALGRQVLAVPNGLSDTPEFRKVASEFTKNQYRQSRNNKQLYFHANALNSRNTDPEVVKKYMESLNLTKDPRDGSIYALQNWYPDIWDEWSRSHNSAESDSIYSEEVSIDVLDEKSVRFKPIIPKFCYEHSLYDRPRVVNEIKFRVYGRDDLYAQALPQKYGDAVLRSITRFGGLRGEWRISRDGVCKMINSSISEVWDLPMAKEVFIAWLKDQGWVAKLSTPGILSYHILEQLNGNIHLLANEQLLRFLEDMNKNHTEKSVGELKQRFPNLEMYLEKGMLTLGYRFSCNTCLRASWYKLSELNEKMKCPKCLAEVRAIGNIESDGGWYYKPTGPFSIQDYANGSYSVLLAVDRFLQSNMRLEVTPIFSFEMENSSKLKLEADFGILWGENGFHGKVGGVIFGECKTFGDFDKKDFQKMALLAKNFPGAVIAFCTLKESLTSEEIIAITKIARKGRAYWKDDRPINPVLILTRRELFDYNGMPYCWEDIDRGKYKNYYEFLDLIDATQQIYLNLPSWKDDWYNKFEAKRKKLQDKKPRIITK